MVTRVRTEGELVVIFQCDGERDDARIVPNGERAAVTAGLLIVGRGVCTLAISCSSSTTTTRGEPCQFVSKPMMPYS